MAATYDVGTRAIVMEKGRISVGEIIALDETPREPMYGVRLGDTRKLMFRASEVARYTEARWDALTRTLEAMFAGFRNEE